MNLGKQIIILPETYLIMRKSRTPLAIDLFCGAGGLSLGFRLAGFKIVGAVDADPIHVETFKKNFPSTTAICADVGSLTGSKIREQLKLAPDAVIDVLIGGPPCQGFSLIGKRQLNDPRNALLGEFLRVVAELKPRYFVLENVGGLMTGPFRSILASALRKLRSSGYKWVSPIRVLDSADYGVPQHRRRAIVLGYAKGECRPEYPRAKRSRVTVREAISDLLKIGKRKSATVATTYKGRLGEPSSYAEKLRIRSKTQSKLTGCLVCSHDAKIKRRFAKIRPGRTEPTSRFQRLALNSLAPTLRAGTGATHGSFTAARPIHPTQARCITVREAARLQSFPDWFEFNQTQWHGFRQVGNSVPPLFSRVVGLSVYRALTKS
jgi:DNA (cytosine-5)-methyltransferase 1